METELIVNNINFNTIPRGQTQKDVNKSILKFFAELKTKDKFGFDSILDIPCGKGEFVSYFKKAFNLKNVCGADIKKVSLPEIAVYEIDASQNFTNKFRQKFSIITCISGVMEFDNTTGFIRSCKNLLDEKGYLVLTNDNCFTIRDRISYLLFGKFRRFNLLIKESGSTYKYIPIQELIKILSENKLEILKIKYTSLYSEDFLLLPFALLIYPLQYFYLNNKYRNFDKRLRKMVYPFMSLLCRHYIIYATKG